MSMVSFRGCEEVWIENKTDKVTYQVAGLIYYSYSLASAPFHIANRITCKQCYLKIAYYSRYYIENEDVIAHVKRGRVFR